MTRTALRRSIVAFLVLNVALFAGLATVALGAPLLGYEVVIIRGGSMEPALPSGSLALVNRHDNEVKPGSIVTVHRDSGVLVTHRVVRVIDGEQQLLELKGDANSDADARPVPTTALVGTVTHYAPIAGFLAFLLRQPSGLVAILSLAGCLLLALRLLEDDAAAMPLDGQGSDSLPPAARSIGVSILTLCLLVGGTGGPLTSRAMFGDSPTDSSTFSTGSW